MANGIEIIFCGSSKSNALIPIPTFFIASNKHTGSEIAIRN